jgi:hypothetical protein
MNKKLVVMVVMMTVLGLGSTAQAFAYCPGNALTGVNIDRSGSLYLSFDKLGDNLNVCNVNSDTANWPQQSCRSLQALAAAAMLAGKPVTLWFNGKDNCNRMNNWTSNDAVQLYHMKICFDSSHCG